MIFESRIRGVGGAMVEPDGDRRLAWQTFLTALAGGLAVVLAFPPVGWVALVWLAPLPWLSLVGRDRLSGRRPYLQIYLAGLVTWLVLLQWLRLPHWTASLGWLALSAYLAAYLPLFVALTRALVHRRGWPMVLAAPLVWTGLEVLRGYLFTGFAMLLLGHALFPWPSMIQVADLGGAYGVSLLVMAVAACLWTAWRSPPRRRWGWLGGAAAILICQGLYGIWRIESQPTQLAAGPIDVMLVQGSLDTTFDEPSEPYESRRLYWRLTREGLDPQDRPDLIIWPESMFSSFVEIEEPALVPDEYADSAEQFRAQLRQWRDAERRAIEAFASEFQTYAILGCGSWRYGTQGIERYNSALLVDPQGTVAAHYRKMHPVMFGEYVPLGRWFPWLYELTPMGEGLDAGREPVAMVVGGVTFSPSICFENLVPQLIRRQVNQLRAQGAAPDVLVTITNDGWFWGSSLLDLHLACAVFRSVEHHLPMLIAANTGFSASIDAVGRVAQQGPRREEGILRTQVSRRPEGWAATGYQRWGDWPASVALLVCIWAALVLWRGVGARL